MSEQFHIVDKLPPYVFNIINEMKLAARWSGEDIIDLGMGNPDLPTPKPIIDKLVEAVRAPRNHRYSASKGIPKLRLAITNWYARRYGVELDPDTEAIATIGAKEGIAHLVLSILAGGDMAMVPNPTYPIHAYSVIIAGGQLQPIPMPSAEGFIEEMISFTKKSRIHPRLLIISFPHNPTTECVTLDLFERVVRFARENDILIIHDLAYADIVFDGYQAPSILQVEGAKDIAVEFFSLSKSYSMAGWRVGFCSGNARMVGALARLKSYLDYGIFQPIQIASIIALNECEEYMKEIREEYRLRRDVLIDNLAKVGWEIEKPKGTMFVWAKIPEKHSGAGSLEFAKFLLEKAKTAVSPGVGFGEYGEGYVRFALVENQQRIRQAVRGIKRVL